VTVDRARSGLRAVGLIGAALLVADVVEGLIPGFLRTWMRVGMFCIAGLMVLLVSLVIHAALALDR
jgi:hypothetical protein